MKTITYPQYLVRPDDFVVFTLRNTDGEYSADKNSIIKYRYKSLVDLGFYAATEEDLPELKKKSHLYYQWLIWESRPDGHGETKGGTFEEFLLKNI